MGNKQLDKFAFMEVLLFSLLAERMLHTRCGFDNVVLGIYFSGFSVNFIEFDVIVPRERERETE